MKAGVITFPGSNCDDDAVHALRHVCHFEVENLWHKDHPDLSSFDLIVLPGGFSHGDYLRCGAMARLAPIIKQVIPFAEKGGLVLGICNGFQILCEVGLLPGALAKNNHLRFVCKDVPLTVQSTDSPWTCELSRGEKLTIPIAHTDGRYVIDDSTYQMLTTNGQILLKYEGTSPNGSMYDIAGICNEKKNVFGLMPHLERASDLRSGDGLKIWRSMIASLSRSGEKSSELGAPPSWR